MTDTTAIEAAGTLAPPAHWTPAAVRELYRLRLADLQQAYLETSRRHFQAVRQLRRERDEAIARLDDPSNGN